MATLERITYYPQVVTAADKNVTYQASTRNIIKRMPQLFWADSTPWREANLWAIDRVTGTETLLRTVGSNLSNLLNYANFLEKHDLTWVTFPARKADRCLIRYRGWLIAERDAGRLRPSTATEFMRNAIAFYRWVTTHGLFEPDLPLWRDKNVFIKYFDSVGFERTIVRLSTDLAIPNHSAYGEQLEDGLQPVSPEDREAILTFAKTNATPELYRMLALGFFSGMRIGSIGDLKIQTLKNATPDPAAPGLYRLNLGPGASPPVHTKNGVTGSIWIPQALLEDLLDYSSSLRRSKRQSDAAPENRDLVFLTSHGRPYCLACSDESSAINTAMSSFRRAGTQAGLKVLKNFHFHQSRCTFATEIAQIVLGATNDALSALALVKAALLHKHEATSLRYIKFVSKTAAKIAASNHFMRVFSGFSDVSPRNS